MNQRAPCCHCGESIALAAVICPFCQGELRVDVRAANPLEPRLAYRTARDLAGMGVADLSGLRRALENGAIVAASVHRQRAEEIAECLRTAGAVPVIASAAPGSTNLPRGSKMVWLFRTLPGLCVLLLVAALAVLVSAGRFRGANPARLQRRLTVGEIAARVRASTAVAL
jgi:hypothetical protein